MIQRDLPTTEIISYLQRIESLGICFYIGGGDEWSPATLAHALQYHQATGRNPVNEWIVIDLARKEASGDAFVGCLRFKDKAERDVAHAVLSGGCWTVTEQVRQAIEIALEESYQRETYAYRRSEANQHISRRTVRKRIFDRDGNRCLRCGRTDRLAVDHVIPVLSGGSNEDENLQTLCVSCNSSKGASK